MTLPTETELNGMKYGELQDAALVFEDELDVEIDRSVRKADLLSILLEKLPSENQETVSEPEALDEPVDEEPEEEPEDIGEEPADEVEEIVDEVIETIDEVPAEEELVEEELAKESDEDLYYTKREFNDWASGWEHDPNKKNSSPKPIDEMTPGLKNAIKIGIVIKVKK